MRQAALKFAPLGPELQSRIRTGTALELDEMAERLLRADTLDAIFQQG